MEFSIVVVDDDEVDRYIVKRLIRSVEADINFVEFEAGDYFVEEMLDDEKSKALLDTSPRPILVLLDINMPRMNGFEVLDALKSKFDGTDQVLIFTMYSSSNHAEDRKDALRFGFVKDYIVKPLTAKKLETLIQRFVE